MIDTYSEYLNERINRDNNINEIANYIYQKYSSRIDMQMAVRIARNCVNRNYTADATKRGDNDKIIHDMVRISIIRKKSLSGNKVPLKTYRKNVQRTIVATLLSVLIMGAGFYAYKGIEKNNMELEMNKSIGVLADNKNNLSIVANNTYTINNSEEHTYVYDTKGIASDIETVYDNDSQLFDVCLYNVYQNLASNKLANMDKVMGHLVEDGYTDDNFFLDYLVKKGYSDDEEDLSEAITNYKIKAESSSVPFNHLNDKYKKAIKKLIDNYKDRGLRLYSENADLLREKSTPDGVGRK